MAQGVGKNHERDMKGLASLSERSSWAVFLQHPLLISSTHTLILPLLTPPFVAIASQLSSFHNNLREWQTTDSLDDGRTPVVKLPNDTATLDCSHRTIYSINDPKLSSFLIFSHHLLLLAFQSYLTTNPWLLARG